MTTKEIFRNDFPGIFLVVSFYLFWTISNTIWSLEKRHVSLPWLIILPSSSFTLLKEGFYFYSIKTKVESRLVVTIQHSHYTLLYYTFGHGGGMERNRNSMERNRNSMEWNRNSMEWNGKNDRWRRCVGWNKFFGSKTEGRKWKGMRKEIDDWLDPTDYKNAGFTFFLLLFHRPMMMVAGKQKKRQKWMEKKEEEMDKERERWRKRNRIDSIERKGELSNIMVSIKKKEYRRKEREKWWGLIRFSTRSTLRLFENPILYPFCLPFHHFLFLSLSLSFTFSFSLSFLLFFPPIFFFLSPTLFWSKGKEICHIDENWVQDHFLSLSSSLFCFFSLFTHSCRFLPAIHYPSGWKWSSKVMLCVLKKKEKNPSTKRREENSRKERWQKEEERARMGNVHFESNLLHYTKEERHSWSSFWLLHPEFLLCLTHLISCLPRLYSNSFLLHFHLQKVRREIVRDERGRDWMRKKKERERERKGMQGFNVRALFQTWGFIVSHFVVSNLLPGTGSELLLTVRVEWREEGQRERERIEKRRSIIMNLFRNLHLIQSILIIIFWWGLLKFCIHNSPSFLLSSYHSKRRKLMMIQLNFLCLILFSSFNFFLSFFALFSHRDLNPPTNKVKEEPAVIITCYSNRTCIHFLLLLFPFLLLPVFSSSYLVWTIQIRRKGLS